MRTQEDVIREYQEQESKRNKQEIRHTVTNIFTTSGVYAVVVVALIKIIMWLCVG